MSCSCSARVCIEIGSPALIMMRVKYGSTIHTSSTISAVGYTVTNTDTGAEVASSSLQVSDVMYDTLQIQDWEEDVVGYDFRVLLPPTHFATAGVVFNVHFTFTTVAGYPLTFDVEVETLPDDE